ncbi:MAG: sigma-54 factor interaction domain-containing protein, partial [Planctomycetota bacterium]
RELANALEHAVILCDGLTILPDDLPGNVRTQRTAMARTHALPSDFGAPAATAKPTTINAMERELIFDALTRHGGDKPKAAAELGIALKTLYNKLNQYQSEAASRAG